MKPLTIIGLLILVGVGILLLSGQGFYPTTNPPSSSGPAITYTTTSATNSITQTLVVTGQVTTAVNPCSGPAGTGGAQCQSGGPPNLIGGGPIVSTDQYCALYKAQFGVTYCPVSSQITLINLNAISLPYYADFRVILALLFAVALLIASRKR